MGDRRTSNEARAGSLKIASYQLPVTSDKLLCASNPFMGSRVLRGDARLIVFRVFVEIIPGGGAVGAVVDQAQDPGLALREQVQRLTHRAGWGVTAAHDEQRPVRFRREGGRVIGRK